MKQQGIYISEEPSPLASKIGLEARQARRKGAIKKCKTLTNSVVVTTNDDQNYEVETLEDYHEMMSAILNGLSIADNVMARDQNVDRAIKENIELNLIQTLQTQGLVPPNVDPTFVVQTLA